MKKENYIPLQQLCISHEVEISFFDGLERMGLIHLVVIEQTSYIHHDELPDIEKMIRLHHELEINMEGIDVVINLLRKIEHLQDKLNETRNRLRLYENG
ncbi:chaperone modulator CbpM [Fulvivirga sedimenti]|uniref:Chaperone modulator CbpM n=1 Tax=Fulvivirga sedimenti TaxID=2879465 RepID=A0A9X1HV39_9BACT|nr:chaperone modulator CbpM [Fulvivirga sedimenti]MCA6078823.1 chaperone modulator CbpM [Fulvivirga sedimenti]